jgi:hypothetical protein
MKIPDPWHPILPPPAAALLWSRHNRDISNSNIPIILPHRRPSPPLLPSPSTRPLRPLRSLPAAPLSAPPIHRPSCLATAPNPIANPGPALVPPQQRPLVSWANPPSWSPSLPLSRLPPEPSVSSPRARHQRSHTPHACSAHAPPYMTALHSTAEVLAAARA